MHVRTCRVCSLARVNTLCMLYQRSFNEGDEKAGLDLAKLVYQAIDRGYEDAMTVLRPELTPAEVRTICWNISSMVTDDDMLALGYKTRKR